MFMVKDEFLNIKNLLKVRFITDSRYYPWVFIVGGFIIIASLAVLVLGILNNVNPVNYLNVSDASVTFLFFMPIGFIITVILFRKYSDRLSVFPQTNNSRLITALLTNYIVSAGLLIGWTVIYLIHYGVIMLMSTFRDNIYLGLNVDFGFIIAGFFVHLMYTLLIYAVIELIGAVLRKWNYYAMVIFTALISLVVVNMARVIEFLPRVLSFLIHEPSLIIFFLKAIGLWLVITAITLVINRFTVYHKSQNRTIKKRVLIICTIIAVAVVIITPGFIMCNITYENTSASMHEVTEQGVDDFIEDFYSKAKKIRIDVSHIPNGSDIRIGGENLYFLEAEAVTIWSSRATSYAYVSGLGSLTKLQGDTIVIEYRPPWYEISGVDIFKFSDPQLTAYLDGDKLIINYSIDEATVIVMPTWGAARQFDIFKYKNLFVENILGYSSGGSMSANIFIYVE